MTANDPLAFPKLLPVLCNFKFPSDTVFPVLYVSKGLIVQKLLVGLSSKESLPSPAATEKLFGVKLLPLPELSLPSVVAVVPELSAKFK